MDYKYIFFRDGMLRVLKTKDKEKVLGFPVLCEADGSAMRDFRAVVKRKVFASRRESAYTDPWTKAAQRKHKILQPK